MKCYSVVAVIALVVIVYAFSALVPLPWYIYLPFILIFLLAYQGDRFVRQLMKIPHLLREKKSLSQLNDQSDVTGKRM